MFPGRQLPPSSWRRSSASTPATCLRTGRFCQKPCLGARNRNAPGATLTRGHRSGSSSLRSSRRVARSRRSLFRELYEGLANGKIVAEPGEQVRGTTPLETTLRTLLG